MFKKVITKKGQELWYKDGKLTAKKYVPIEDIEKYEVKEVLTNAGVEPEPEKPVNRGCIFCGAPVDYQRYAGNEKVNLCGDCYYTRSLGDIVTKLRKDKE